MWLTPGVPPTIPVEPEESDEGFDKSSHRTDVPEGVPFVFGDDPTIPILY